MNDLISRQAAIEAVSDWLWNVLKIKESDGQPSVFKKLRGIPTADTDLSGFCDKLWKAAYERGKAEAVKHGEWLETSEGEPCCSICGKVTQDMQDEIEELEEDLTDKDGNVLVKKGARCFAIKYPSYCSRCGARMRL